MPFDGTGTYNLPAGNPVVTNTVVNVNVYNNTFADIATALTNSLTRTGETTVTGGINFNGKEIFFDDDKDTSITAGS